MWFSALVIGNQISEVTVVYASDAVVEFVMAQCVYEIF